MKKSVVKILILMLVAATLLSALSVSAFAAGSTVEYTLKAGDTVAKVCAAKGLSFEQCKEAIMKLNGITSENEFKYLKVGRVIKLPASNADAALIVESSVTTQTPTPTPTPTQTITTTTTVTANTISYVLKAGDTVAKVCAAKGLNFDKCKAAIMILNGITSENEFKYLKVGRTIKLPATDAEAAVIVANGTTTGTTGTTTGTGTGTGTVTGNVASGDYVAYYLVPHIMQAGESVYKVCLAKGINFSQNEKLIKAINDIKNYNHISVGTSILFPSNTAPTSGSFYKVIGHKLAAGETVYKLCTTYGLKYSTYENMIKALNDTNNLARVKAGSILYLPVLSTASAGGTVVGGTGGTGTGTGGVTTVVTNSIVINASKNGTVAATVNGANAAVATSGSTVNIVTTPAEGYAVESITVTYSDGSAKLHVNSGKFVMPECSVTIDVVFAKAYTFVKKDDSHGSFTLESNGMAVTSVPAGANVKVNPTPNAGYALKDIQITYKGSVCATVDADNCFTMPAHDVTITVSFKQVDTYKIITSAVTNGSYSVTVKNGSVKEVAEGVQVTVKATPNTGYTLGKISVLDSASNSVKVTDGVFTMPASDVTISVTFKKIPTYSFEVVTPQNGTLKVTANGAEAKDVYAETSIKVTATADAGYTLKKLLVVNKTTGSEITLDDANSFKMPEADVKVLAEFEKIPLYDIIDASSQTNGTYTINLNGEPATEAEEGKVIQVVATPADGYKIKHIRVFSVNGATTVGELTVTEDGRFTMPAYDVKVFVAFEKKA